MSFIDTDLRSNAFAIRRLNRTDWPSTYPGYRKRISAGCAGASMSMTKRPSRRPAIRFGSAVKYVPVSVGPLSRTREVFIDHPRPAPERPGSADFTQFKIKENQHHREPS